MASNRKIYLNRSKNLTEEQIIAMMEAETILTPEQCVEYGFLDEVRGYTNPDAQMQSTQMRMEQIAKLQELNQAFAKQMQQMSVNKETVATSQQEGGNPEEIFGKEPEPDKPRELNQTQQKALRMMGAFLNANM